MRRTNHKRIKKSATSAKRSFIMLMKAMIITMMKAMMMRNLMLESFMGVLQDLPMMPMIAVIMTLMMIVIMNFMSESFVVMT